MYYQNSTLLGEFVGQLAVLEPLNSSLWLQVELVLRQALTRSCTKSNQEFAGH